MVQMDRHDEQEGQSVFRIVPGTNGSGLYSPGASEQPMGRQDRPHPRQAPPLGSRFQGLPGRERPLLQQGLSPSPASHAPSPPSASFQDKYLLHHSFQEAARQGCEIMHLSLLALAWRSVGKNQTREEVYAIIIPILQKRKLRHTVRGRSQLLDAAGEPSNLQSERRF